MGADQFAVVAGEAVGAVGADLGVVIGTGTIIGVGSIIAAFVVPKVSIDNAEAQQLIDGYNSKLKDTAPVTAAVSVDPHGAQVALRGSF